MGLEVRGTTHLENNEFCKAPASGGVVLWCSGKEGSGKVFYCCYFALLYSLLNFFIIKDLHYK